MKGSKATRFDLSHPPLGVNVNMLRSILSVFRIQDIPKCTVSIPPELVLIYKTASSLIRIRIISKLAIIKLKIILIFFGKILK